MATDLKKVQQSAFYQDMTSSVQRLAENVCVPLARVLQTVLANNPDSTEQHCAPRPDYKEPL